MVILARLPIALVLVTLLSGPTSGRQSGSPPPDPESVAAVGEALSGRHFPWYDSSTDDFRPITPPKPPAPPPPPRPPRAGNWSPFKLGTINLQDLGRLIIFILLAMALMGLILYIARTWQRRLAFETVEEARKPTRVIGSVVRFDTLPTGLVVDESDPLETARRFRQKGELGRAVVFLFAHQLLMLDRLGMIRLAPGRTGRQLVRSINDESVRGGVGRTLRMFEAVYYGHREPNEADFEALWAEAESLDAILSAGGSR